MSLRYMYIIIIPCRIDATQGQLPQWQFLTWFTFIPLAFSKFHIRIGCICMTFNFCRYFVYNENVTAESLQIAIKLMFLEFS